MKTKLLLASTTLASVLLVSGCLEYGVTSHHSGIQIEQLVSMLDKKVGFSECATPSGISVLRPLESDSLNNQVLYLSNPTNEGYEYATLRINGLKLMSYTYDVEGVNSSLSGTLSITLTSGEEIYLYTEDVNGIPSVTEPCLFNNGPVTTVNMSELEYGSWLDYSVQGENFKSRTVRWKEGGSSGYQIGPAKEGRRSASRFIEYGISTTGEDVVITGISREDLEKAVIKNFL